MLRHWQRREDDGTTHLRFWSIAYASFSRRHALFCRSSSARRAGIARAAASASTDALVAALATRPSEEEDRRPHDGFMVVSRVPRASTRSSQPHPFSPPLSEDPDSVAALVYASRRYVPQTASVTRLATDFGSL